MNSDYSARFRLAEVKDPYFKNNSYFTKHKKVPLDAEHIQVLHDSLVWSDFSWGISSVLIEPLGTTIGPLQNFMFRPKVELTDVPVSS